MVLYLLIRNTLKCWGYFTHTTIEMNLFDRATSLLLMATSNGEVLTIESLYKQDIFDHFLNSKNKISYCLLFLTLTPICMHFVQ